MRHGCNSKEVCSGTGLPELSSEEGRGSPEVVWGVTHCPQSASSPQETYCQCADSAEESRGIYQITAGPVGAGPWPPCMAVHPLSNPSLYFPSLALALALLPWS